MNAFLAKKWPIRILLLVLVVGILSAVPKLPKDQTLRIDLGDSSKIIQTVTLRWAPQSKNPSIEDWTGEVTFRYEKKEAPRVVQQQARLAEGDYVVEIQVSTDADHGSAGAVTRRVVALQGGSTTIDASSLVPANAHAEDDGTK